MADAEAETHSRITIRRIFTINKNVDRRISISLASGLITIVPLPVVEVSAKERLLKRHEICHVAIVIAAQATTSAAIGQSLPTATPGAPCSTPGMAAVYGHNGMLLCSASMTWKPAIPASSPPNDGGLASTVGERFSRATATVIDEVAKFVRDMLSTSAE